MTKSKDVFTSAEGPKKEKVAAGKPKTQTLYTHGKVYKLPADANIEEFLKEKFPSEYK